MANCMLGFPNRVDSAALSGGAWTAGLPLANVKNRVLGKFARTQDAQPSSTWLDIDLGIARNIRALAVVNHNFSLAAKYRLRGADVSDFSTVIYDTGSTPKDVWPVVFPASALDWEDDNWWSGRYTAEQITGYTPTLTMLAESNVIARYWRLQIFDADNAAGYLQFGRIFIGPVWQPALNMSYGASLAWETKTEVQEARSGAEYFDVRVPYRVQQFTLDWMKQDEAFSQAFELFRRAGIDKELLWIHDPDDTVHAIRRRFLARLRTLSPIEYPYPLINKTAFEIKELL